MPRTTELRAAAARSLRPASGPSPVLILESPYLSLLLEHLRNSIETLLEVRTGLRMSVDVRSSSAVAFQRRLRHILVMAARDAAATSRPCGSYEVCVLL